MSNEPVAQNSANPADWTFLSNHAHVLVCVARMPDPRVQQIAREVGITERSVLKILADLEAAGVVQRFREGRTSRYSIQRDHPLRHPIEKHRTVGDLLEMLL